METHFHSAKLDKRVNELIDRYADPSASLAWIFCDQHDPVSTVGVPRREKNPGPGWQGR